jgi:hypothetical protein
MGRTLIVPRWITPCLAACLALSWHATALAQPATPQLHAAIYDPLRQRMIVFGGYANALWTNATWQLTLGADPQWSQLSPGGNLPSKRLGHSAVYDPVRDRMLVFGGLDTTAAVLGDVWALSMSSPPAWSALQPSGGPPLPRRYHTAIYDPLRDRMIVFGGTDAVTAEYIDTWSLWLSPAPRWEPMMPHGNPPAGRYGHSAIYDPVRDRMLVFGGYPRNNQTWALSFQDTTWRLLSPSTAPKARDGHSAVYDPVADRMIVFGGNDGNLKLDDVWQLSLPLTAWSQVAGVGNQPYAPTAREYQSAVYDSASRRMVIFGGFPNVTRPTWALPFSPNMRWSPFEPMIDVLPAVLQLPTVTIGDTVSASFSLSDGGMTRLQVSGFKLPTANPGMWLKPSALPSLAWSEAAAETLVLAASVPGSMTDSLVIVSNDPLEPRKRLNVQLDVRGLEFEARALAPLEAPLAESLTVIVRPEDGVRIDGGTFCYRIAGSGAPFDSLPLAPLTLNVNDYFVAGVPASAVTELGVEYYVRAVNSGFSATQPPGAPAAFFTQNVKPPHSITAVPAPTSDSDFLEGRDIEVQVLLPAGSSFVSGTIYYRRGGDVNYESAPLAANSSGTPVGTIPASVVGSHGVEYWVEASTHTTATPLRFPSAAPDRAIIRIKVQNLAEDNDHPGGRYRMLSVPLDFGADFAGSLDGLLTDQFGAYYTVNWRLYSYDPDAPPSIEFSSTTMNRFRPEPGRAFWLISRQVHRVDTNPIVGFSTTTGADYAIDLKPGWNQFGNPFDFPVAWSDVRLTPSVADSAVAFVGSLGSNGDYAQQKPTLLMPFEGYFIHADAAGTLWVPPIAAPTPLTGNEARASQTEQTRAAAASGAAGDLWRYGLRASTEHAVDGSDTFGAHFAAKSGFDRLDDLKPPPPPGPWVRIAFVHPEWQERAGQYARDLRAPGSDGETWEIEVRSAAAGEPLTVNLTEIIRPSPDLSIRLIDREQGSSMDASRGAATGTEMAAADGDGSVLRYRILSYGTSPYRLAIVAGSAGYVAHATEQALATPARVTLDPGAPNPFRVAARIRFGLPRAQVATLEVYNVIGQRVATLLDQAPLPPGYHTAIWDGRIRDGAAAPSGVYFLRLVAGGEALTHRIVRIQ